MGFAADQARIVAEVKVRRLAAVRAFTMSVGTSLIVPSPVDSGRFRANWRAAVNGLDDTTDAACDVTGQVSLDRVADAAAAMAIGDAVRITNALPYARRLEYGWSKQAPAGMVRVTAARAKVLMADAVRSLG